MFVYRLWQNTSASKFCTHATLNLSRISDWRTQVSVPVHESSSLSWGFTVFVVPYSHASCSLSTLLCCFNLVISSVLLKYVQCHHSSSLSVIQLITQLVWPRMSIPPQHFFFLNFQEMFSIYWNLFVFSAMRVCIAVFPLDPVPLSLSVHWVI